MNIPSIGRIVHYRGQGNEAPMAAIITWVHNEQRVNLAVFTSTGGLQAKVDVPYAPSPADFAGQCWSWPERIVVRELVPDEVVYPEGLAGDYPSGQGPEQPKQEEPKGASGSRSRK